MCGIVGVIEGDASFDSAPVAQLVSDRFELALASVPTSLEDADLTRSLRSAARSAGDGEAMLRGVQGVKLLAHSPHAIAGLEALLDESWRRTEDLERALDAGGLPAGGDIEATNAALVELKDLLWRARRDHLRVASVALDLAGRDSTPHAVALFGQIEIALSAIDRMEVRGRDSAGIAVIVRGHGLDLTSDPVRALLDERSKDPLFRSGSVRESCGNLCFVYKAAAEVGELGDNTRAIREELRSDACLQMALRDETARAIVLGHTRWASVGMISEPNAHPVSADDDAAPAIFAVLNGDIDNHADITSAEHLDIPPEITTDTKIIPMLVARRMASGASLVEAFRGTVSQFEGSVAIALVALNEPDKLLLALRGSGQAAYIGHSDSGFLVASEPYGFVEQASSYVRMDGEATASNDRATRGQIVVLREPTEGEDPTTAIERITYDGTPVPVLPAHVRGAEITTRDVDRGPFPHFLLKELHEAPRSFRQTLRGRLVGDRVVLGAEALPEDIRAALREGAIRRIVVIGQGTAAIAGRALAATLASALTPAPIVVEAAAATELSGFGLREDMSDTVVIAISQSGTTADTNRTVEVARARQARVIAIVNRRQSDLTDRADGVLYTSDGRDVEMAVPSTKAFYAQVAAGFLLAAALAAEVPGAHGVDPAALAALRDVPEAMEDVLARRAEIAEVAQRHVPSRRDWAVVGNGVNRIAAEELRIKLSELCYKSISSDVTEDKKHIDLSAEPLILVCAAGLGGSNAEDVAKEVVYFRAHKAAPIVICGEGEGRYDAALDVIRVPSLHPDVAFLLSAMAGHVFGYEAALVIDGLAKPLRAARSAIEATTEEVLARSGNGLRILDHLRPSLMPPAAEFFAALRAGSFDGHLEPSTAVRLASLFRYATGLAPLDAYQIEYGKTGVPGEVLADLMDALVTGIDKLTRPVDAIRHQAKTVTVGITRAEETLLQVPLVREVLGAGVARDRLSYATLRTLAALDPAVDDVTGYTLYRVEGDPREEAFVRITDRGGVARDIRSRTEQDPRLRGNKHRVAVEREVLVTRGHDGRTLVIVPEVKGAEVTGIALLHVRFSQWLAADVMRNVLQGYRDRYTALRDIVTETEPTFRDDLLGELDVTDLLIASVQALAEHWRQPR